MAKSRRYLMVGIRVFALSLLVIAPPASALAEPIMFAAHGSTSVAILNSSVFPPLVEQSQTSVVFDADTLPPISSSLTGSGTTEGFSGSANTLVTDSVIGVFATGTSPGSATAEIVVNASAAYLDYFTVLLPEGSFVPMLFTLDPSYTITTTGEAFSDVSNLSCASLQASLQVAGGGSAIPTIGSLHYSDISCSPQDALLPTIELMVPTGVPFRMLYEMSATIYLSSVQAGTGTVDALHSLQLFADPVGNYTYETISGNNFSSGPAPVPVPEPATLFILGSGLGWLEYRRRRIR